MLCLLRGGQKGSRWVTHAHQAKLKLNVCRSQGSSEWNDTVVGKEREGTPGEGAKDGEKTNKQIQPKQGSRETNWESRDDEARSL